MQYTLLNKRLNRRLTHPSVGLWFTPHLHEAADMLKACKEYLEASNLNNLSDDFVVIDAETGEEIHD